MRLTFHGTLLGIILLLIATVAMGPARQLWTEHAQIRRDEATLAAGTAEASQLTGRIEAMRDPKHVEQLARDQLGYVRPGETSYIILHPEPVTAPPAPPKPRHISWLRLAWSGVRSTV